MLHKTIKVLAKRQPRPRKGAPSPRKEAKQYSCDSRLYVWLVASPKRRIWRVQKRSCLVQTLKMLRKSNKSPRKEATETPKRGTQPSKRGKTIFLQQATLCPPCCISEKEDLRGAKSVPAKVAKTEANKGEEKPKPESRADPPTEFISVRAAPPPENMLQGFKALAEVLLRNS